MVAASIRTPRKRLVAPVSKAKSRIGPEVLAVRFVQLPLVSHPTRTFSAAAKEGRTTSRIAEWFWADMMEK